MEYLSICFPDSLPDHSVGKESACSPKGDQSWVFIGRTNVEAETEILWSPHAKCWLIWKDWCWERLRAGGEGDDRGWDGWLASPTQWTWVWVNSGNWWWTGRPGVLRFIGSQRVGQDWATKLNWSACNAEDPGSIPGLGRSAGEGLAEGLPTPVFFGFPYGSADEESACNAGDLGLTPGLGRSPGEGKDFPLQYSGLKNPMEYGVHGVTIFTSVHFDFFH